MDIKFRYDQFNDTNNNSFFDDLLTDHEDVPTEKNPFCNETEEISYNEDYSHIVPAFFFRNTRCSLKPSDHEKKRLRFFYNMTGILLFSGVFIFFAVFLIIMLISLMLSFSFSLSSHSFGYILKDDIVVYSSLIIAVSVAVPAVCAAGCRFSEISFSDLLRSSRSVSTPDILCCIMTGLFLLSLRNAASIVLEYFTGSSFVHSIKFTHDFRQIIVVFIFECLAVPVSQGLIFRGIALKNLSRASQKSGMYTASFLCAVASLNAIDIIPAFFISMMLSKLTFKYSSVLPGIAVHIVINSCSMIIRLYDDLFMNSESIMIRIWTVITFALGIFFTAYLIIRDQSLNMTPEQVRRTIPLYLTSPLLWLFILICVFMSAADTLSFIL